MSNESKIIEEALDRNPIGLREALDEELKNRIKERLTEISSLLGKDPGVHVTKFPSGKYGYTGNVPKELSKEVPANKSAIMGQRAVRNDDGELVEYKTLVFDSQREAVKYAKSKGYDPKLPKK